MKPNKEVKVQLQATRDHLTECQELLQNEITDLEFERNVKLHEHGLGKTQRACTHYMEYTILDRIVVGLAIGAFIILSNFRYYREELTSTYL